MDAWPDGDRDPLDVVVPEDASSLEPDRQAWLAEHVTLRPASHRAAHRAAHRAVRRGYARRLTYTRRRERHRLSGPVVTLVLMTVGVLGLITIVSVSAGSHAPPARDLAPVAAMPVPPMPPASVDAVEGQGPRLGHLLPTVQLSSGGREVRSTDIRPAVVALLPADCDCAEVVRAVRHQARSYGIDVWVVGSGSLTEQVQRLRRLDAQVGSGTTRWAVDESSVLSRALAGNGLTIAFVGDDGVVQAIDRDMPVTAPGLPYLGRQLAVLVTPDRT